MTFSNEKFSCIKKGYIDELHCSVVLWLVSSLHVWHFWQYFLLKTQNIKLFCVLLLNVYRISIFLTLFKRKFKYLSYLLVKYINKEVSYVYFYSINFLRRCVVTSVYFFSFIFWVCFLRRKSNVVFGYSSKSQLVRIVYTGLFLG